MPVMFVPDIHDATTFFFRKSLLCHGRLLLKGNVVFIVRTQFGFEFKGKYIVIANIFTDKNKTTTGCSEI